MNDKMTGKEICLIISKQLWIQLGMWVTPMKIWEMSPTGELFHVWGFYYWAKQFEGKTI